MARGEITSIENVKTNNTKAYISARQKAEEKVMASQPQEPPVPTQTLVKKAQEMFDNYIKVYPELNIKHSQLLTTLVMDTMEYNKISAHIRKMKVDDPDRTIFEKRAQAYSKEMTALFKEIQSIKTNLLKQAIDIAKVEVEEQKAQAMSKKDDDGAENPLLVLLKNQNKRKGAGA